MKKDILYSKEFLSEKYNSKDELPQKIRVESSTICQLNCPCCYMRLKPEMVKKGCKIGYLKFSDFKKLVDENYFTEIELSNSGEMFLNPDLIKIMEYAFLKKIKLTASNGVNLNNLTNEQAEALVKYQFDEIIVSIDGASQETYKQYRRGGNFNTVINNIKKIIKYKEQYNSFYPLIKWKFIIFGHNEHEITKAQKMAEKIGIDRIFFAISWDKEYSPIKNIELVNREANIDIESLSLSTPITQLRDYLSGNFTWFYCEHLWEPQINWDGQLLGCSINFYDNMGGNVFKDGFFNALNNEKYILTKNIVTGKVEAPEGHTCFGCHIYKAMKEANFWMVSQKEKFAKNKKEL